MTGNGKNIPLQLQPISPSRRYIPLAHQFPPFPPTRATSCPWRTRRPRRRRRIQRNRRLAASEEVAATSSSPAMILVSTVTEQHSYIYASGRLLRETITTTAADGTVTTEVLDFAYDAQGTPYSLTYTNGTASPATYYYITNLQGDVTQLIDSTGKEAASYSYDPYGKVMSARGAMAETNPLRYRGYYYDADTELYYLQSRYYDANVCRFINADSYSSTGTGLIGYNMFSYCNNDPVKKRRLNREYTNFDLNTHRVGSCWRYLCRVHCL